MNVKLSLLATSVALALVGCGGGSSDKEEITTPTTHTITAIDGYLQNAEVWVDVNNNHQLDVDDKKVESLTDANGQVTLSEQEKKHAIFVKAIAGKTIDSSRGLVAKDFGLATTAGSTVANPMTNLVIKKLEEQQELSESEAKQAVVAAITETSGLEASESLIFGDYIAVDSNEADALNVIGESLVDNAHLTLEKQLEVTTAVAKAAQEIMEDPDGNLDDFSPIINTDSETITVTPNSRPTVISHPKAVSLDIDTALPTISVTEFFTDKDADSTVTYSMFAINGGQGLTLTGNQISGKPTLAGNFKYHIFATDNHGAKSYPAKLNVTVTSPNNAPTVDEETKVSVAAEITSLAFEQNLAANHKVNIAGLFNDVDGDELTITSLVANNVLTAEVIGDELTISGTPTQHGTFALTLEAFDGVAAEKALATFSIVVIEAVEPPPSEGHPLEGKTWYVLENGRSYNNDTEEFTLERVWCDSYRYQDGKVYNSTRSLSNLTSCSPADTPDTEASYTVNGNKLIVDYDGDEITYESIDDNASNDIALSAQTVIQSEMYNGTLEKARYTYFSDINEAQKHINIQSDGSWNKRAVQVYIPAETESTWEPVTVSVALHDSYAYVNFDGDNKDFTCSTYNEWFGFSSVSDGVQELGSGSCSTQEDKPEENEETYQYASVTFNFNHELDMAKIYSVILQAQESEAEFVENVKLNITWTGVTDNE